MNTYVVTMFIRAENRSDVMELITDYTGQETDVTILCAVEVNNDI